MIGLTAGASCVPENSIPNEANAKHFRINFTQVILVWLLVTILRVSRAGVELENCLKEPNLVPY